MVTFFTKQGTVPLCLTQKNRPQIAYLSESEEQVAIINYIGLLVEF